jgi:hypothetical protein
MGLRARWSRRVPVVAVALFCGDTVANEASWTGRAQ